MKKLIIGTLAVLLAISLGVLIGWTENIIPAPFSKAKEMALKVQPDMHGRYQLYIEQKTVNGNSEKIFLIGYLSRIGLIGIGIIEKGSVSVIEYNEESKEFFFFRDGLRLPLPSEKAIEGAFSIFREMVSKNLI